MSRKSVLVTTAVLVACVGVVFALRAIDPTLWRGSRPPDIALQPAPEPPSAPPLPIFSLAVDPELETRVTAENAEVVASDMAKRAEGQIAANTALSGLGAEMTGKLVAAVREQAGIYLSGSFDKYMAWSRRSGSRQKNLDGLAEGSPEWNKAVENLRGFWTSLAETIALKPVSVEKVTVRLRWLRGVETPTQDDRYAQVMMTRPDAWPHLAGEPKANGYTIVEFLFPAFYFMETDGKPVTGKVYFAIWLVWDEKARDWRIHQTRVYDPLRSPINFTCPAF